MLTFIAQIKEKGGIDKREYFNKPKSVDSKQPQIPADKEQIIMDALKHFNIIRKLNTTKN